VARGSLRAPLARLTPGDRSAHQRASTDKSLKNHGRSGSRHNGGHKHDSPLILLMFSRQNIPCAGEYSDLLPSTNSPANITGLEGCAENQAAEIKNSGKSCRGERR
jgi:hypothetical protein